MRRSLLLACLTWLLLAGSAMGATTSHVSLNVSLTGITGSSRGPLAPITATSTPTSTLTATRATSTNPIPVIDSDVPPAGRKLSSEEVLAIAARLPKLRALLKQYPGAYSGAYLKGPQHWQVSYFSRGGKKEIAQIIIDDFTGKVLEQWTGFQVAWTMARGYPGAFGRHVNSLYIWLPLCVLFILPFFNFRRPFSLLHLDLLMLLSFSVSLAFFNNAHIYASVPLSYPPLLYLLARMLSLLRRARAAPELPLAVNPQRPLRLLVPASWLAVGVVFLLGFRIALNVTDSNVIDVGYASVIGAQRIAKDRPLYGSFPSDNEHGDTYGPVNYEAYVPAEQIFGWSGTWDDLPAAHAAAVLFDLLAVALLFLIGRRMRGPTLGVALAYAWASYPFTLFALESNSNDTLVAVLVLAAVLAASYRSALAPVGRGALAALAGLTKFAPLALAPILATHGLRQLPARTRPRALVLFVAAFLGAGALAAIPALSHDSLHTIYERTFAYQTDRGSPFSLWGLYGWHRAQELVELATVVLVLALAVIPRRPDIVGLAGACAAAIIATELSLEHWFYLYIPWFFGLVIVALLGNFSDPSPPRVGAASAAARSSLPEAALSS